MGGSCGGLLRTCLGGSGHSNGRCTTPPGVRIARQRGERGSQYSRLPGGIAGLPQGAAQRVLDGGHARRSTPQAVRSGIGAERDGGEAGRFDFALYQSNGPAAHRSGRHQHDHIRMVFFQIADEGRHGLG